VMAALCEPAALLQPSPARYNATFSTSAGTFVIEVQRSDAPSSADRFYHLVRLGFYDKTAFYRNLPGFVVQWGPSAIPALSRVYQNNCNGFRGDWAPCSTAGACFWVDAVKASNTRASVSFSTDDAKSVCGCADAPARFCGAREGQLVAGSEIFINLSDNSKALDKLGFAPFGWVVEGMENVEALHHTPEMDMDTPPPELNSGGIRQCKADSAIRLDCVYAEGSAYLAQFPQLSTINSAVISMR